MAINYTKMAAKAQKLITDSGKTITLVETTRVPEDTDKPWNGPDPNEDPNLLLIPGVQIVPNAVRIFDLSALGTAHEFQGLITYSEIIYVVFQGENDLHDYTFVRDGGVDRQILATQTLKPANTTLLGFIGVRR